jgi:3-deoxy-D-manno-octulosonate 8-phosphate phosphatase (KDO 8-P phosphatase)
MATPESIRLLALDVDGVVTDGGIYVDDDGRETKRFHVRDGYAMKLWQSHGFKLAWITGRSSQSVAARAEFLGIDHLQQGVGDKRQALDSLVAATGVPAEQIAFLGDDWPDLPILRAVGYPMAVADAEPEVARAARFVTPRTGGNGAVRDAVEHLLRARKLYSPPEGGQPAPRAI